MSKELEITISEMQLNGTTAIRIMKCLKEHEPDIWHELKEALKQKLTIPVVSTCYLCECGKVQTREEMRRQYDFGYDQLCCTKCGDVLIDDLHGVVYCNVCSQPNKTK